ncbi:MAG: NAD(P)-dependent oxidoreductase [Rectinemataceae bacterium]|jgi:3-hydroxyisobutyrate dehydrogenase
MEPAKYVIGFIGIGVMGSSMAGHLLKAGYRVHAHTRTKEKARALLDAGAVWEENPEHLVPKCSVVFTMVGYPSDVEGVYFGPKGLIENAMPGTYLVDCSTSKPDLARRIHTAAQAKGLFALDAPVSGGDIGAKNGTLTIMVGGERADFDAIKPLFELMGATIILQGGPGSGQHTKMANQIAIAGNLAGAVEAISYAKRAGLDPRMVLQSIGSGSAGSWQLNNMVPRMLDGNFEPGFYVKHFLKDLRIALDSARAMKVDLPLLALAERLFESMQEEGLGDKGTQALYLLYERRGREGERC